MRIVGMEIHRSFAQVAILESGQITRELRVDLVHGPLVDFAKTLSLEDEVVIEATGNSAAVERLMRPYVKRVDECGLFGAPSQFFWFRNTDLSQVIRNRPIVTVGNMS